MTLLLPPSVVTPVEHLGVGMANLCAHAYMRVRSNLNIFACTCECWRVSLRNQTAAGRMERLTSALKSVLDKKHDLQTVVSALENLTPTSQERKPDC